MIAGLLAALAFGGGLVGGDVWDPIEHEPSTIARPAPLERQPDRAACRAVLILLDMDSAKLLFQSAEVTPGSAEELKLTQQGQEQLVRSLVGAGEANDPTIARDARVVILRIRNRALRNDDPDFLALAEACSHLGVDVQQLTLTAISRAGDSSFPETMAVRSLSAFPLATAAGQNAKRQDFDLGGLLVKLFGSVGGLAVVVALVGLLVDIVQNRWGKAHVEVDVTTTRRGPVTAREDERSVVLRVNPQTKDSFTVQSVWLQGCALKEKLHCAPGDPISSETGPREYRWLASAIEPKLKDVPPGGSTKLKPRVKVTWRRRPWWKRVKWTRVGDGDVESAA